MFMSEPADVEKYKVILHFPLGFLLVACSDPKAATQNKVHESTQVEAQETVSTPKFSTEFERMNYHHPVDWKRFSGSNQELAERFFREKNCYKLQEQFDSYQRAWSNYRLIESTNMAEIAEVEIIRIQQDDPYGFVNIVGTDRDALFHFSTVPQSNREEIKLGAILKAEIYQDVGGRGWRVRSFVGL